MRKSFILYTEWKELFDKLDCQKAGELIKAIFSYQVNEETKLSEPLSLVFINIRQAFDRDELSWNKRVSANKENIRKRWGKNKEFMPSSTIDSIGKIGIPKLLDNGNINKEKQILTSEAMPIETSKEIFDLLGGAR